MRIDIWSDVVCPWCYLGARRLDAALDRVGRDGIELHWRAFQLDPAAPPEPGDLRAALEHKYGPGAFDSMTRRLTALGAAEGIDYRFDLAQRVNTADAHRLISWAGVLDARGSGDGGRQAALVERLFHDFFTVGAVVSDPEVLVAAAAAAGLDEEAAAEVLATGAHAEQVHADRAEAVEAGISGVPAFVVDHEWVIPGAQDTDRLVQLLERARDRA